MKKRTKKILIWFSAFVTGIIFLLIAAYLYLPSFIESSVVPGLCRKFGVTNATIDVRQCGFYRTDLADLSIGAPSEDPLKVDSIRIDYSPTVLFSKHIDKIVLNGSKIKLFWKNGKICFPAMQCLMLNTKANAHDDSINSSPGKMNIPVSVGLCEIRNVILDCELENKSFQIPVNMILKPADKEWSSVKCQLSIFPGGQQLRFDSVLSFENKSLLINIPNQSVHLNKLLNSTVFPSNCSVIGKGIVDGYAELGLMPFKIKSLRVSCSMNNMMLKYGQLNLAVNPGPDSRETFRVNVRGNGMDNEIGCSLSIRNPEIIVPKAKIKMRSVSIAGKTPIESSTGSRKGTFKFFADEIKTMSEFAEFYLPEISCMGNVNFDGSFSADSRIQFQGGVLDASRFGCSFTNIEGIIPLHFPYGVQQEKGQLNIGKVNWKSRCLGSIKSVIAPIVSGIDFNGKMDFSIIKSLVGDFNGNVSVNKKSGIKTQICFGIPGFNAEEPFDLGTLHPKMDGIYFNGAFKLSGDMSVDQAGVKCQMESILSDSTFDFKSNGLILKGVNNRLKLNDVFRMQSPGHQVLQFKNASWEGVNISDGKIEYRLGPSELIFIENSSFAWCGGHFYIYAMRLQPGKKKYNTVLFCDRIKLSEILEQFSIVQAEGEGAVNGRIPVWIEDKKIRFKDGFLYSTPGAGGRIRITGTDFLTAGVPVGSLQYAQLEFSRLALTDFKYEWVKVRINSSGRNLLLKLSLLGKPANPLPFKYNPETGGWVRITGGRKVVITQPILLDINFKLPLNRIMHYGIGIQNLLDRLGENR